MRLLRSVYEGPGSHGSLRVAASMKRIHAVLRAPPGEGYFPALYGAQARTGEPSPVSLSPARERADGSPSGRLERDLKSVIQRYPDTEAVLLVRSEVALLSGEEIPRTELPENPKTGREIELVTCDWESPAVNEHEAADLALESLVRAHAESQEKSPTPTVNVFGPPALGPGEAGFAEAERLLNRLGVQVNARVPLGTSVEDLSRLSRAWANLLLYREAGDAATLYLREEFGTPRVTTPMFGAGGTGSVLRSIGELCGIEADKVQRAVWSELARTAKLPWYSRLAAPETIRGRRVAIFGDFTHAVGLGYTLAREVGLEIAPCGTYLKHLEHDFLFHTGSFTDEAFVADDPEEVAARLKESRPDVLIGTYLEEPVANSLDIPFIPLCPPAAAQPFVERPLMGYAGCATLADALDGALRRVKERPETTEPGLPWTEDALEELEEIPAFLRGRARRLAEEHARELDSPEITREILEEARL